MKNNREIERPKYKRNKEKKSRRGHVACKKEKENREKGELERGSTFSLDFPTIGP